MPLILEPRGFPTLLPLENWPTGGKEREREGGREKREIETVLIKFTGRVPVEKRRKK